MVVITPLLHVVSRRQRQTLMLLMFSFIETLMFSRVQVEIVRALAEAREPLGARRIASMTDCSVSMVWRQLGRLSRLNIVIPVSYGRYRRYRLNWENPLARWLAGLHPLLNRYGWLIGRGLFEAISMLHSYYVSGVFALKGVLRDLSVPDSLLLVVGREEYDRALQISEWFKGVFRVDVIAKNLDECFYEEADSAVPYNYAVVEQAVADSAGTFSLDPVNNVEAVLLVLYHPLDYRLLRRALDGWGDEALFRVWYVMMLGRAMGIPLPASMFKPHFRVGDEGFERLVLPRVGRILRPDNIVRVKGW